MRKLSNLMAKNFPTHKQRDSKDCGPTCLKIISKYYKKSFRIEDLRQLSETQRSGTTLLGISNAAEKIGYRTIGLKISKDRLAELPLPCILHWNDNHFVVLYKIHKLKYYISDPAFGLIEYSESEFLKNWSRTSNVNDANEGFSLIIEPDPSFLNDNHLEGTKRNLGISYLLKYFYQYRPFLVQLILGVLAGSLLQLFVPFLTQSIVDVGIKNRDINFIYLILFGQVFIFIGRTSVEIIRRWIILHLSTRINISLISNFFIKLMNLPISFFDSKKTGDLLQRINDHERIERLITQSSLDVLFSMVNVIVFGLVLAFYDYRIFITFMLGSFLYFFWIKIFLKKRAAIDYKKFARLSQEQSKVIELINGIQEIKLHNAEKEKRWGWEDLQAQLFKVSIEGLALEQYQSVGSGFINELKNISITILSAKLVIDGDITLGMMLAISYIVGQLNGPISQLINFIKELQDAQLSLDRLSEIHNKDDEENLNDQKIVDVPLLTPLTLKKVSYRYTGSTQLVLEELDLRIPSQKITAIVGTSGSGKTTLMKLLLKFYDPTKGIIKLGATDLKSISQRAWRAQSGVVMQEGYIFSDTIARNISVGDDFIDKDKLLQAVDVANIQEFIEGLPLSYNTKIGMEGLGLSTGQKQRILIARAVYKNPNFLFFDEATSALDAHNEKIIMEKLNTFFKNKTVVVIAHRLSTVKNADQIVVLEKGKIIETGTHIELVKLKGSYFTLVKNQLELGK